MNDKVYVYAGWMNDALIGVVHVLHGNGRETVSFDFGEEWLQAHADILLDPNLAPFAGRQYPPANRAFFGMLSDVCPDRWGRRLIQRREEISAAREQRPPRHLYEMDYLTSITDLVRTGGLRFKFQPDGEFITASNTFDVPPVTELRELEQASLNYEFSDAPYETKWLAQLLSPGSSLGGARPKANIMGTNGELWIAKFPSRNDDIDIGAWEYVTHELAALCGLNVPEAKLQRFSEYGSTFMVKRFDRKGGTRIHFASAMTMLDAVDGQSERYSYLDIAEFLTSYGRNPAKDLEELYRRIAFSIAVSNHDDHLRNHGVILREHGWELSPAYDLNPSMDNLQYLSLNINLESSRSSFDLLQSTAEFYQLSKQKGEEIIERVRDVVHENWLRLARQSSIPESQIKRLRPCFEIVSES